MKFIRLIILLLTFTFSYTIYGQVGIGTTDPDSSSVLDIKSSNAGLLIPRIALTNTTTAAPVTSPAESLLIYNTNTADDIIPGFYYWDGLMWRSMGASAGPVTIEDPGGGSGGEGSSTEKAYGEYYYDADVSIQMLQYTDVFLSIGTRNTVTTSNITTSGVGFKSNAGGVYRITMTITYSKNSVNDNVNTVEFCLAKNNNIIPNTTIIGDLNNDLKRRSITLVKILSLEAYQTYHFGIKKTGPSGGGITIPKIILHKDMTNMTIERIN